MIIFILFSSLYVVFDGSVDASGGDAVHTVVFALDVTVHETVEEHSEDEGRYADSGDGGRGENGCGVHDDPPL